MIMMPPQHDIGGSNQHRHGDGGGSSNDSSLNNHDNIWSKIEAERRRQSNIRLKLQSGGGGGNNEESGIVGGGSSSNNDFLPPPKSRASYPAAGNPTPITFHSSLPPLPRSISTPGESFLSKSNRSRRRTREDNQERKSSYKHRERRSSSPGNGSGGDGGGGGSSSHHSRKKKKKQSSSISNTPKFSRSKSAPIANLKSTTTISDSSTTMWVPHLYPNKGEIDQNKQPVEVTPNYDNLNRRYSSQYSQDSEINTNSNRSTPASSRHSRKSVVSKDIRQDSDEASIDSDVDRGVSSSKRSSERRKYRNKSRSKSSTSAAATSGEKQPPQPRRTKSSDHTLDTKPSSFASTIFTQPNSFAEGSTATNTYPQSPAAPGQKPASFATSDYYYESSGPGQPSSFASESPITPGNDSTGEGKPPSSKSNSIASSGRMSHGSGRLSSVGESQKSLPPPIPPEQRRKSTKKNEEDRQRKQQQNYHNEAAHDDNGPPPLPLVSSEWCIDSKPSSFLQPPDTRLRNAPTPHASSDDDDDDSKSFNLEELTKNNDSARSDRSHCLHASQKLTWDTKRVIAKEDVIEAEGWVYCIACILLVATIGGIGGCVLFVFGAWDVDGSELYGQVQSQVEYLSTNASVFDDPNSPQSLALNWIVHDDEGDYDVTTNTIRREQRYSLAVLYYSTNGPTRWINNLNFLSPENECQWNSNITIVNNNDIEGAVSETTTMSINLGTVCAEDSQTIMEVRIVQNDLQGTVPVELSGLSSLKDLTLNSNDISGTLPDGINIETLERFDLSNNNIHGIIPESFVGNLASLRFLDVTMNQLSSSIPMTSLEQLSNLESLRLGHNQFSGSIDDETAASIVMSNLLELNLTSNSLEGSIDFLSKFNSLQVLDISMNQFFGTLPPSVGDSLNKLQTFVFADNIIQGPLPNSIGSMTDLMVLVGSRNSLSGTFPFAAINNSTSNSQLQEIDIEDNSLTGSLPSIIGLHPNLEMVNFRSNQLSGSIPNEIGSLNLLNSLKLSLNNLSGRLPTGIGTLQNMVSMDVSGNSLEGNIPTSFGAIQSLQQLELNSNSLTGSVPTELAAIPELETLNLHDNALTGSLEFFCKGDSDSIPQISADCAGDSPEISCSCCAVCL